MVSIYLHSSFWWAPKDYFISAGVTFRPFEVIHDPTTILP